MVKHLTVKCKVLGSILSTDKKKGRKERKKREGKGHEEGKERRGKGGEGREGKGREEQAHMDVQGKCG
jgi:hypothetical protein